MNIKSLSLHNFRSFKKQNFDFTAKENLIIGPNTSGKSNLLESIYLLSVGHSPRATKESEMIRVGQSFATVTAEFVDDNRGKEKLEIQIIDGGRSVKKFKINDVPRSMVDYVGTFPAVLFEPEDIQLVLGAPDLRRNYLNMLLFQVNRQYRRVFLEYEKVRRQRNKLLEMIREGVAREKDLEIWDDKLLESAPVITKQRADFFDYLEKNSKKIIFSYHQSVVNRARLLEFHEREIGAAATLIGPHRDDFKFFLKSDGRDLSLYGSRGQQRMAVFSIKMQEIEYLKENLKTDPMLLLDDIFSELDVAHRGEVLENLGNSQVILTTTEKEFIEEPFLGKAYKIFL